MNRFGIFNVLIAIGLVASLCAADEKPECQNHPEKIDLKECCPHQSLITKEIEEKCKKAGNGDDDDKKGGRGRFHCFMECALNETGVMNGQDVDKAKLEAYVTTVLSETPELIPIVSENFENCVEKAKEMRAKMEASGSTPPPLPAGECKPCAKMIMMCTQMETMFNCPESLWKNDENCNKNRDFFKECRPPHHHHHHHPHH